MIGFCNVLKSPNDVLFRFCFNMQEQIFFQTRTQLPFVVTLYAFVNINSFYLLILNCISC